MPLEIMDQRGLSASSQFYDDISRSESNRLWQPNGTHDNLSTAGINEMGASPGGSLDTSLHSGQTVLQVTQMSPPRGLAEKQLLSKEEGFGYTFNLPNKSLTQHLKQKSKTMMQPISAPYGLVGTKIVTDAGSYESTLFSSSLSEIFTSKMMLQGNDVLSHQSAHKMVSNDGEELHGCHRKVEAGHIGNILPDEDDLFSGVNDDLGFNADSNTGTDFEDFDVFSSGGGLELEEDKPFGPEKRNSDFGGLNYLGVISGKQQLGKYTSRTLVVRNICNNIEDSELMVLFMQFGDIRTLYTTCKCRGFVMISYYDLRAAQNAMRALQNKPLHHRKLDIHFSIPQDNCPEKDINHGVLILSDLDPPVSNDKLLHIFGFYGEIKDIYEIPEKHHVKLVEFYDVRAANSALRELSGSQIAGRQIKLELGRPGDALWCLMQHSQKGQDEHDICNNFPSLHHGRDQSAPAITSRGNIPTHTDMGSSPGLYPSIQQTMSEFNANSLPNGSRNSSLLSALPTSVGSPSTRKLLGVSETNYFLGTKATSIPRFHPLSFPEFRDTVANDTSCNSSIMDMTGNIGSRMTEGIDGRHIQESSSTGNLMEYNGGFASSGNGNYAPHGLHHMWNKSNVHQQHPLSHMLWQNSLPLVNGACARHLVEMPGFPRVPHHMLRTPNVDHHVRSAPVVNGSPWDRRHSNLSESPKASSFLLGSLGSAGFPVTWQFHPAEVSGQNMFPHIVGNPVDMIANSGQISSKQICRVFPWRSPAISISRHDAVNERSSNLYHHRSDSNSTNADKKKFELDIDSILRGEDNRTTVMIKNIPNKYTSKLLLAAIDEQCRGTYDFIYLPIDFKNKCNVGYAFINMIDPSQIVPFYQAFNGKKWEKFNSEKVASLAYARIQGKAALIVHFQNSSLMNEDKRCRPILFHTDGPNAGDPEPFPMGANIRSRPGKFRSCSNEDYRNQGNLSASASGDESTNGTDSSLASKISD